MVTIISSPQQGSTGVIDGPVFQRTVDFSHEYSLGHHFILKTGEVATVRWGQPGLGQIKNLGGAR